MESTAGDEGCLDPNATNFDANATAKAVDQYETSSVFTPRATMSHRTVVVTIHLSLLGTTVSMQRTAPNTAALHGEYHG